MVKNRENDGILHKSEKLLINYNRNIAADNRIMLSPDTHRNRFAFQV